MIERPGTLPPLRHRGFEPSPKGTSPSSDHASSARLLPASSTPLPLGHAQPLEVADNDALELPVEEPVDEGVNDGVAVPDPEDDAVDDGRGGEVEDGGDGHPEEEGQPADEEDAHDDAEGACGARLALLVVRAQRRVGLHAARVVLAAVPGQAVPARVLQMSMIIL